MKRIFLLMSVIASFMYINVVKAESFNEGSFISGEYINKVKNGKTYYLTAQFINDNSGDAIYCLEPFVDFSNGNNYVKYENGFEEQLNLSKEQVRRIKLLGYFGYMYNGRTDSKWYVITQYLIWKTIDSNADIYFTDRLNGNRIDKYINEINEIERDVNNVDEDKWSNKTVSVYTGEKLVLEDNSFNYYNVGHSDYEIVKNNNYIEVKDVTRDGIIILKQSFDRKNNAPAIYIHTSSQKLFKVGKPEELEREIRIKALSGSVLLDIQDDDSVYSIEKKFENVCYGIFDEEGKQIDKVCTDKELKYKKDGLRLGTYTVKQLSTGIGYVLDNKEYKVDISEGEADKTIVLKNKLIRNDIVINKSYCKGSNCLVEAGAVFNINDSKGSLVKVLTTDNMGIADIELGYGSYTIEQIKGKDGYSMADIIETRVENEIDKLLYNINNNYIEETKIASVNMEIEELPPDTKADSLIEMIKNILDLIRNYFYNFIGKCKNC